MFTGIIKAKGTVSAIERIDRDVRMTIMADDVPWSSFSIGESIAVNGVCLTAVELRSNSFLSDVSVETLNVTTLGQLVSGATVNLEPAMAVGDRFGGHLVSGHVDCMGTVTTKSSDARSNRLSIEIPPEYLQYIARKGSVCVDGVSLTVNEVSGSRFDINIIPHTADFTIMGEYDVGTVVNIEVDMLARYIERLLGKSGETITVDFLRANGYA